MKTYFLLLLFGAISASVCPAEENPSKAIVIIADKIKALGVTYPQLKEFSIESHLNKQELKIEYKFHTHKAPPTGGWTSGVPHPDPDGIWFYIDFHDSSSSAEIHTQPFKLNSHYLGDKSFQFLILEGNKAKSVKAELWKIFKAAGVTERNESKSEQDAPSNR